MTARCTSTNAVRVADASVAARYELDCTDCEFNTTLTGTLTEALDAGDAHRAEMDAGPTEHFTNIHRRM